MSKIGTFARMGYTTTIFHHARCVFKQERSCFSTYKQFSTVLSCYYRTGLKLCHKYPSNRNFHCYIPKDMAKRHFEGKEHAQSYARFRPTYPEEVFERIVTYYKEGKGDTCNFDLAVDVGCGNGQSTRPLCKYFRKVIGCDVSQEQIFSAENTNDCLSFIVSAGEDLSFLDKNSVDLLTISQALHWLDQDKFYAEVTRVLKPGGVYAALGYGLNKLENKAGNDVMWQFYSDLLGSYWDEKRVEVDEHYKGYELPFPDWQRLESPDLTIKRTLTVEDYVGYLSTFSAWRKYDREHPNSGQLEKLKKRDMAKRYFEEKEHAQLYARFRPTYPGEVFEKIVTYYKEGKGEACNFDLAVDVGCGNGQSTRPLCKYFRKVIGCDISQEQIFSAENTNDCLSFIVSPGEDLRFLDNNSVDLVTISEALHWLDQDKFYVEVTRVLKPGGVYAALGYGLNKLENKAGNDVMWQFHNDLLGRYWDETRVEVEEHYKGYELPFPDWQRLESPDMAIKRTLTIEDYVGFFFNFLRLEKI